MTNSTQSLSRALEDFRIQMQDNADAIADLIEQREQIRVAPANQVDVYRRMKETITAMSARYLRNHKLEIGKLTSSEERDDINLFTMTISIDGTGRQVFDPDALVFFNQEHLLVAADAVSKEIALPNAGLPRDKREKKIAEIDERIGCLEDEKQGLFKQAGEAGLVVTEEYVAL